MKRLILLGLLCLLLVSCASAPRRPVEIARGDLSYLEQYMDWYFARQMSKHDVPGVAVALVSDDKILWMKAYGYADVERHVPVTTRSVFQVGSITKAFTAAAVMQMVERGRVDLEAPIQQYVPEFSMRSRFGVTPRPTLRELLSHHSGLPTYYLKGFFSNQPLTELVRDLKEEDVSYPPRGTFNYSNLGPDLAGAALEHLARQEYGAYMQQALLEPLGMQHSSFALDERTQPLLARGYVYGKPKDLVRIRDVPAGGLFSNVEDLARFMRMMLGDGVIDGRRILSHASINAVMTPQFLDAPYDFGQRFGLGWMLTGIPIHNAGPVLWHNGGTKKHISQTILLPEKKLGVVVLANSDSSRALVYEAAEKILHLALEAREGIQQPAEPPAAPEVTLPVAALERYAGDYSLMGALANIKRAGNHLQLNVLGNTLELVPIGAGQFRTEYWLFGLIKMPVKLPPIDFVQVDGRTILVWRDRGTAMTAEKVPDYEIPAAWQRRVGTYHLINPDAEYEVDVDNPSIHIKHGKLLLHTRVSGIENREVDVVLMPVDDDTLYVFGVGRHVGDVTRAEVVDGRERLRYLGYYFERDTALASAPP